jgi:hypothetical protein
MELKLHMEHFIAELAGIKQDATVFKCCPDNFAELPPVFGFLLCVGICIKRNFYHTYILSKVME